MFSGLLYSNHRHVPRMTCSKIWKHVGLSLLIKRIKGTHAAADRQQIHHKCVQTTKLWRRLTIPVVRSLGFFMMMATCSFTSLTKRSTTPGCVCRTVQQMWMLKKSSLYTYSGLRPSSYSNYPILKLYTNKDVYLAGNCNVLRFQPFAVSAFERRKISKSSEPKATTDTSGSPSTITPFILRILPIKVNNI